MNKYIEHFKTITKHKLLVTKLCFKCGFYKRGIMHDLSKFGFLEFSSSARYFQGNRSPIEAEKDDIGYSLAWQHHKGHNPHHWEYWVDNVGTKENTPIKIPLEYVIEMLCDWVAAGIIYSKQEVDFDEGYSAPLEYFEEHLWERIFHEDTYAILDYYLTVIQKFGVNTFCRYVKARKTFFPLEY